MATIDPPPARRKFLPEPVGTSSRYQSKHRHNELDSSSPRNKIENPPPPLPHTFQNQNETIDSSESTTPHPDTMVPPPAIASHPSTITSSANLTQTKPRRFLPQPVEESVKSSRRKNNNNSEGPQEMEHKNGISTNVNGDGVTRAEVSAVQDKIIQSSSSTRRFAAEPVETSTRSTRRKFAPEPVETTSRSSKERKEGAEESDTKPKRRLAPEPVETSTRSSKDTKDEEDVNVKPRRRFAPEPVESSTRSSKSKTTDRQTSPDSKPRRRFLPEPVETSTSSSSRRKTKEQDDDADDEEVKAVQSKSSSRTASGGRRFKPQLIETAKGSFKQQRRSSDASDVSDISSRRSSTASEMDDEVPEIEESRFSAAALAKKNPPERQHSYIAPDLPIIESDSGSDVSEAPSLSDSPSSAEAELEYLRHTPRHANSSYTEYVLRLAAQTTLPEPDKRLQEQAMAAYINERPHEPVDHFAIDSGEEEDTIRVGKMETEDGISPRIFRRSSQADLDWEMSNMRKHHAKLDALKREFKADIAGQSRFSAAALASRHHIEANKEKKLKKAKDDEDAEFAKMKAAASPPMAGADIVFPQSLSPKMTRCETDQVPRPRTNEDDDDYRAGDGTTLWSSKIQVQSQEGQGLWMGLCQAPSEEPNSPTTPMRSGIQTPANGMWGAQTPGRGNQTPGRGHQTPGRRGGRPPNFNWLTLTPARRNDVHDSFIDSVDKKLRLEKQIEEEFPDRVISQIYNYLSLGYPALAHAFDEELSKISRIPLEDLRRDDEHVDAKGYVGAPEGDGIEEHEAMVRCERWKALKLYVREWARQSPNFADARAKVAALGEKAPTTWGTTIRKGSWGL